MLATNVAETSLTVPGIRYVIDPGMRASAATAPRSKVQRLPIESDLPGLRQPARGSLRAGRRPGVCIRLYSKRISRSRPEFTEPEILRTNLAAVILQMSALHLGGSPDDFPFVEPPESRRSATASDLLQELAAVDGNRQLTPLGRQLARLPVDPRLGRMLLAAARQAASRKC